MDCSPVPPRKSPMVYVPVTLVGTPLLTFVNPMCILYAATTGSAECISKPVLIEQADPAGGLPPLFHCPSDMANTKLLAQGTNLQFAPVWSQTHIGFFQ